MVCQYVLIYPLLAQKVNGWCTAIIFAEARDIPYIDDRRVCIYIYIKCIPSEKVYIIRYAIK